MLYISATAEDYHVMWGLPW